jgi:hypothetical protein
VDAKQGLQPTGIGREEAGHADAGQFPLARLGACEEAAVIDATWATNCSTKRIRNWPAVTEP